MKQVRNGKIPHGSTSNGELTDEQFDFPISEQPDVDNVDPESVDANRRSRIEMLAYAKAESRGFKGGSELEDWLEAEREINQREEH